MLGLVIGRFQPIHLGHQSIIDQAYQKADQVLILISSSQESRTDKNPLTFEERKALVSKLYPDAIILPLKDIGVGNNSLWGDYVYQTILDYGYHPDIFVTGEEERRLNWFQNHPMDTITVSRSTIPISSTLIRENISNKEVLKQYIDSRILEDILSLKEVFLESQKEKNSKSI